MKDINLTMRENMIMEILWNNSRPMTVSEIIPLAKNTSSHTVHALLNSLMDKGLVKVVGSVKLVKVPCRLYETTISKADFAVMKSDEVFGSSKKIYVYDFMTCLVKRKKDHKEEIVRELEDFIRDYKEQINKDMKE